MLALQIEKENGAADDRLGRTIRKLRPDDKNGFEMARKKVMLVNSYGEIPTMAFLT